MATKNRLFTRLLVVFVSVFTIGAMLGVAAPAASAAPTVPALPGGLLPLPPTPAGIPVALVDLIKAVQNTLAATRAATTALQTSASTLTAQIQEIASHAQDDPQGAVSQIQAAIQAALPGVEGTVLTQALALASKIAAPICPVVGAAAALLPVRLPTIPDYSIFGPLAATVYAADHGVDDALFNYYVAQFTKLITPISVPPQLAAAAGIVSLAQALLGLLKLNYHTTYYPYDGQPNVVRDTPAFLNLPMVIDTDNNVGFDVCANFGLDLTTLAINQQIDRVPTGDPTAGLDIQAQFLGGVISPGYSTAPAAATPTTKSHFPAMFETTTTLTAAPTVTKVTQPGIFLNQTVNLTAALQYRLETIGTPPLYSFATGKPGPVATAVGTKNSLYQSAVGTSFAQKLVSGATVLSGFTMSNPSPMYGEWCTSTKGYCSNEPLATQETETTSTHYLSNPSSSYTTASLLNGTACPQLNSITTGKLYLAAKIPTTASPAGRAWIDTDNQDAKGCIGGSLLGAVTNLPLPLKANDRLATWSGTTANTPALTKSGTITCPAGTSIKNSATGITLSNYLCSIPPVNVEAPKAVGQAFVDSVLTADPRVWTPSAPNAPTFTYQWQSCDGGGNNCFNIAGPAETGATYLIRPADLNRTVRVVVTGTNLDGASSNSSVVTPVITLPPTPVISVIPQLTGLLKTGEVLHVSDGTFINAPKTYAYQWQRCDMDQSNCADIVGQTTANYTLVPSDIGHWFRAGVKATNAGGTSLFAYSDKAYDSPAPVNQLLPFVKNGASNATGQNVLEGDHLSADNGTWLDGQTFTYQWEFCDNPMPTFELTCFPIVGATLQAYTANHDNVGHKLRVIVTAHNPNGELAKTSEPTDLVLANSLLAKVPNIVPDGVINSSADSGHESAIVGGQFDTVGKLAGKAGAVAVAPNLTPDVDGFSPFTLAAQANGDVLANASDLTGGYYIGGSFTKIGTTSCVALAHIKSDGSLDPSLCGLIDSGEVRVLSLSTAGTKLLGIGGAFTATDAAMVAHSNLMWIDFDGGPTKVFSPADPNGPVNAITNDAAVPSTGNGWAIGGKFSAVGVTPVKNLAEYAATAGPPATIANVPWTAGVCDVAAAAGPCTADTGLVKALTWNGLGIFVGGKFGGIVAQAQAVNTTTARNNAAAFASNTAAAVKGWNPNANGQVNIIQGAANFGTTSGTGSLGNYTLYLGGEFTTIGAANLAIPYLAEFGVTVAGGSAASGTANNAGPSTTFVPAPDGPVTSLASAPQIPACTPLPCGNPTGLYVGGSFKKILGQQRNRLALIDGRNFSSTAALTLNAWAPFAGNDVLALSRDAANLFVGGKFTVLGGVARNNVAELKPNGTLGTWNPAGTNGPVNAVLVKGGSVYVGGAFSGSGADVRNNAAAFDGTTAVTTGWNPNADGPVNALVGSASGVFVGGNFSNVGGAARNSIADVDGTTGSNNGSFNPGSGIQTGSATGKVFALAADLGVLYVGGSFDKGDGLARANTAAFNAASGALTGWSPGTTGPVSSLAANAGTIYVGGVFGNLGGQVRNNLGATSGAGATLAYNPNADGAVRALRLVGSKLFVGGSFAHIGGAARSNAAQIDSDSGGTGDATGFIGDPNGPVLTVMTTPTGVLGLFGGFSLLPGGVYTSGVAFYGP